MTDCPHPNFKANVEVHRIVKEEDAAAVGYENAPVQSYVFEASVECSACGRPFEFEWERHPLLFVPIDYAAMREGPWTDFFRTTINASIKPMSLDKVHATNKTDTKH